MSLLLIWKSGGIVAAGAGDDFTLVPLGDTVHYPYLKVEVAFTSSPTDTSTWTEITEYVRSLTIRRGRNDELNRTETSTCEVELNNLDGRFDPTFTSSPYYPNVTSLRQIRVRASWDGVVYNRFRGYIESWPMSWPDGGFNDIVGITASDVFGVLNLDSINAAFASQLTSARVTAILNQLAVPAADQSIATGVHTLAASGTYTGSPLEPLFSAADGEGGLLFVNAGGTIRFQNRRHRLDNEGVARGTFGDDPGELSYQDLTGVWGDPQYLLNQGNVTWSAGSGVTGGTEIVTDTASTALYRLRRSSLDTELARPGEAAAIASLSPWLYSSPTLRLPSVPILGAADPTNLWPIVLGGELSQRYLVNRRPPSGNTITQTEYLEGITETITPDSWTTEWNLSPFPEITEWLLGTSTLGTDTTLGV